MTNELTYFAAEQKAAEWKAEIARHGYTATRLAHGAGRYSIEVETADGKIVRAFTVDDGPVDFAELELPSLA